VTINRIYDADTQTLKLWVKQAPGKTKSEPNLPFHIPLRLALFDQSGTPLPLDETGTLERVFDIREADQTLEFHHIPEQPLMSALRGFSAPVILKTDLSRAELAKLMTCDSDAFNQWDAAQQFASQVMLELIQAPAQTPDIAMTDEVEALLQAYGELLDNSQMDRPLLAEMLSLPDESYLAEMCHPVDVHKIHQVREFLRKQLASRYQKRLRAIYDDCQGGGDYEITPTAVGKRRLKNSCLHYLALLDIAQLDRDEYITLAQQQFDAADNMTDQLAGLSAVMDKDSATRSQMLDAFYQQWSDTALVVNKWFSLQAAAQSPGALDHIIALAEHPAFNIKNPNRVRSLLGPFQGNVVAFHHPSGRGYAFYADMLMELDSLNPLTASRLVDAFLDWNKLVPELGEKMKQQVLRLQAKPGLSDDVAEKISACLAAG